jgi:hypothetical protein
MAMKYKNNSDKINFKMGEYKGKSKKKLFSIFKVYDHEKDECQYTMHSYKRNLTPIKENYVYTNPNTPYDNNLVMFSSSFVHSSFK